MPSARSLLIFSDVNTHPLFRNLFHGAVFFHFIQCLVDFLTVFFIILTEGNRYDFVAQIFFQSYIFIRMFDHIITSQNSVNYHGIDTAGVHIHINSSKVRIFSVKTPKRRSKEASLAKSSLRDMGLVK